MSEIKPLNIKGVDNFTEKNTRAYRYFSNPYSNNLILAGKNSGKTTLLYRILEKSIAPGQTIHIFSSTYNIDPVMKEIINMISKYPKATVIAKPHFIDEDTGLNYIEAFLDKQKNDAMERDNPTVFNYRAPIVNKYESLFSTTVEDVPYVPPKKWKQHLPKNTPKHIIVIDDLSHATRDPSLFNLMTKNRHYSIRLIILSHFITSLAPNAINQLDNVLVFGCQPPHRIQELNEKLGIVNPKDTKREPYLQKLYDEATKKKYNFLKIDKDKMRYYLNFQKELI